MPRRVRSASVVLLACAAVVAQRADSRAAAVPTPEAYLGRPLGRVWTRHSDVVGYARAVAAASDRVRVEAYGRTPEGRELVLVTVTAPENFARAAEIDAAAAKLADPRLLAPGEDVLPLLRATPVTVWLSFNVHGDEPSPSETFLVVLHRLATADDAASRDRLRDAVVVLDPCLNPDGRDRYANWFNTTVGSAPDPDPAAREHAPPWPGGRQNHFQFDLNRDWAYATQDETRARLREFVRRRPQVHADYHEMGAESSYFFFPAEKPINANLPPSTLKWGRIFGDGNAAAFDREGLAYYTSEDFDLFFPGYGDSWPSLFGAVGMTYEMAGGGAAGTALRRRDGTLLTLDDRIRRHALTAFATIEVAAARRAELLADWFEFRRTAIEEGRGGSVRAVVLETSEDPSRADALVGVLLAQGVEVSRAKGAFTAARLRDIHGRVVADRAFEAGTYVVRMDQPMKRLAKTLLEPRTEIRELYFYDVSAWSLPLAFGVAAFETDQPAAADLEPVLAVPARAGGVDAGPAAVGWILDGSKDASLFAACDLLREGVRLRCGRKDTTLGDAAYARGAFLVRREENGPDVAERLARIGAARGARFRRVDSGRAAKGADLGSSSFAAIAPPRVILVGGEGTDATSFGATRFLLDRTYGVPYTVVDAAGLSRVDLGRATAVVLVEGATPGSAASKERLRAFVRDGGALVALGSAAFALCADEAPLTSVRSGPPTPAKREEAPASRRRRLIEEREEEDRMRQAPGSFFLVELDPAHPVSFGYRGDLVAFKSGTESFDPAGPGVHVGVFKDATPVSGYVNPEDERGLRGRSYVAVEPQGRGAVVLFADDPNFRGGRHGLARLFLNACLLLPDVRAR